MLGYLFEPDSMTPDKYNRASTHREGAWSILTGIAAGTLANLMSATIAGILIG